MDIEGELEEAKDMKCPYAVVKWTGDETYTICELDTKPCPFEHDSCPMDSCYTFYDEVHGDN